MLYPKICYILIFLYILSSCSFSSPIEKEVILENSGTMNVVKSNSGLSGIKSSSPNSSLKELINIKTKTRKNLTLNTYPSGISEVEKNACQKKFTKEFEQKNCLNNLIIQKAVTTKNSQECENIADLKLKNSCTDNVLFISIMSKKDASLCTSLKSKEAAGSCFANVGSLTQIKNQTGSIMSPCTNISDSEIKIACDNTVIFNQAISKSDDTLCEKIIDEKKRLLCKNVVKSSFNKLK